MDRDMLDGAPRNPAADALAQLAASRVPSPPDPRPVTFSRLVDGMLQQWTVVEIDGATVPGAHGARCLIFARPECIRRVWDYPSDWRALDADALMRLSWHR